MKGGLLMAAKPAIIAYDISDNKTRKRIHKILKAWRIGGQKSVHECLLTFRQAEELFLQLGQEIDQGTDKLLLAWIAPGRPAFSRGKGSILRRKTSWHVG